MELAEVNERLCDVHTQAQKFEKLIREKVGQLGIQERKDYCRLKDNKFIQHQMNARALKLRLLQRLRDQSFELAKLEGSYRNAANGKS